MHLHPYLTEFIDEFSAGTVLLGVIGLFGNGAWEVRLG